MSRSIQRSKCNRSCLMCKPHKVTGERPIAERATLTIEADLVANEMYIPSDPDDYDDYLCDCAECVAELPIPIEATPLRATFGELFKVV
jgi:hypothetical protein